MARPVKEISPEHMAEVCQLRGQGVSWVKIAYQVSAMRGAFAVPGGKERREREVSWKHVRNQWEKTQSGKNHKLPREIERESTLIDLDLGNTEPQTSDKGACFNCGAMLDYAPIGVDDAFCGPCDSPDARETLREALTLDSVAGISKGEEKPLGSEPEPSKPEAN